MTLIHNPSAGHEDHDREGLLAALSAAGHQVEYRSSIDGDWEQALAGRPELVVVAGGDGTVNQVFKKLAGTPILVTLLPLGTANNIADTLGFASVEAEQLVGAWSSYVRRPYDLGEIAAPWGRKRFVEGAGGRLFGDLFARAEDTEGEDADDKVRYGLELLRDVLSSAEPSVWEVDLDGNDLSAELLGVEALNIREAGPEIRLAPAADPTDGLLEVVLIAPEDRDPLREHIEARLTGGIPREFRRTAKRGRELTFRASAAGLLHVDDEPWQPGEERRHGSVVVRTGAEQVCVLAPEPGRRA